MSDVLTIWTVYRRPRDYPHCYVARRALEMRGLTCLPRDQGDEPHIIESWI